MLAGSVRDDPNYFSGGKWYSQGLLTDEGLYKITDCGPVF